MRDLLDTMHALIAPLKRKIALMVSRAVVGLVDDNKKMQSVQLLVLAGEVQDTVERFQNFGFTAVPLPGSEAVVVYAQGERDHPLCIAIDDRRFRLKGLTPGQSAQYDALGNKILLSNDGKALVDAAVETHLKSATVKLGLGSVQEKVINGETFQAKYNTHQHTVFGVVSTPPMVPSIPLDLSQAVTAATLPV